MQTTNDRLDSNAEGRLIAIALMQQIPLEKRQALARKIRQRQSASVNQAQQGAKP